MLGKLNISKNDKKKQKEELTTNFEVLNKLRVPCKKFFFTKSYGDNNVDVMELIVEKVKIIIQNVNVRLG